MTGTPGAVHRAAVNALKAARSLGLCWGWDFFERGFWGDSALCGGRPGTLPLDSATFEKVDETFMRAGFRPLFAPYASSGHTLGMTRSVIIYGLL